MTIVQIRPSLRLAIIVVAMHAMAAFSLAYVPFVALIVFGEAVVLVSLLVFAWRSFNRRDVVFGLEDGGTLMLSPGANDDHRACVMPGTTVSSFAVWLLWRDEETGKRGAALLLSDQISPKGWRALQVWVRLKASAPQAVADAFSENNP